MSSDRRANNSFVIFRFGEDNSENVILNLPSVLMNNSDTTNANPNPSQPSTQPQQQNNTSNRASSAPVSSESHSHDHANANTTNSSNDNPDTTTADESRGNPSSAGNSTGNTQNVPEEHIARNMLVSVSYVYSGDGTNNRPQLGTNTGAGGEGDQRRDDRTGSILLNVPNIPNNRNESQLNALIEFAASLALSAIAANIRRNNGIKKETFEKLKVKSKNEVHDKTCAICYDEYVEDEDVKGKSDSQVEVEEEKEKDLHGQRKRKRRDSDDGTEERQESVRKVRRTENATDPATASSESLANESTASSAPASASTEQSSSQEKKAEEYKHVPLVLPCEHYFGRSCIFEWLKSNSTCPLCRQPIAEEGSNDRGPPDQINIPNIASLLNPTTRDHPMVLVLDRATNTLIRRPEESTDNTATPTTTTIPQINPNTPEAAATQSLLSALTQPRGVPLAGASPPRRDPLSASILRGLNQPRFPGLFSSGVASRRTETGVETVNLNNDGLTRNDFDNSFYDESRRLIEERLRARHLRESNTGSSTSGSTNSESLAPASNDTTITAPSTSTSAEQATTSQSQPQPNENNETTDTQQNAELHNNQFI